MFTNEREMSDVVARVYTLERRMQDSVLTGRPSTYVPARSLAGRAENLETAPRKPMWAKIAQFLTEKGIWPIDYIARQFDQACSLGRPLFPNQLIGDMAWQRYTNSTATKQKELEIKLRSHKSFLLCPGGASAFMVWPAVRANRSKTVEGWLSVLYCNTGLSPLFVYSVAMNLAHNQPEYADDAEKLLRGSKLAAAVEYVRFRPDHDAVWGALIPRGFRPQAERIYRELLTALF
jgi:hypothetical protein